MAIVRMAMWVRTNAFFRITMVLLLLAGSSAARATISPSFRCADGVYVMLASECKPLPTPGANQPGLLGSVIKALTLSEIFALVGGGQFGGVGPVGPTGPTVSMGTGQAPGYRPGGQTGAAAAGGDARWNLWAAFSHVDTGYSFQPLQSGGNVDISVAGLDYRFSDSLVGGVAVTDERIRITTSYNGGRISGNGNTVSPYLGWRIDRNWALDASLGFGDTRMTSLDNSVAGGITGSNKVERTTGTLGLTYNTAMGRWLISGRGGLLTFESRSSQYTATSAFGSNEVAAVTMRTTQARLGGQAAYNAGTFVPFVGLTYIYDVQRANQDSVGGQSAANDRDGWQMRAGLNIRSAGALYGGIVFSSEVGRSQVKSDQIMVNLGVRF